MSCDKEFSHTASSDQRNVFEIDNNQRKKINFVINAVFPDGLA